MMKTTDLDLAIRELDEMLDGDNTAPSDTEEPSQREVKSKGVASGEPKQTTTTTTTSHQTTQLHNYDHHHHQTRTLNEEEVSFCRLDREDIVTVKYLPLRVESDFTERRRANETADVMSLSSSLASCSSSAAPTAAERLPREPTDMVRCGVSNGIACFTSRRERVTLYPYLFTSKERRGREKCIGQIYERYVRMRDKPFAFENRIAGTTMLIESIPI